MNSSIQILLAIATAATSSFLQTPSNQLDSTFNSTFLTAKEPLFKPIIIPNITKFSETPQNTRPNENPEDSSRESSEEEPKTTGNPLKFSSRYSTRNEVGTTEFPPSKNEEIISHRSDDLEDNKNEHSEESEEVEPTTESSSYEKYLDREKENDETSTTEETESSEEKESEDKRSVEDYYNSGSKNYHSIQTPLDRIKYQGPHSFRDDRKRIVPPIPRRPATSNWPYSKSQIKTELEKNEISEEDEEIREEVKTIPEQLELESAEEKDRNKFERNKKYNYIELRDRRTQQQKALIAEEEKDNQKPLFKTLKQYLVDEEEQGYQPKEKPIFNFENNGKISKNSFRIPKIYPVSKQASNFQGNQFLGPVVFNQNNQDEKTKPQKDTTRNIFLKGLIENEKLDQENLTNERSQKSVIRTGSKISQSFNHLKESDEMYNAILANIQSVFGIRTQPLKRNQKGPVPEVDLDESKALTWTLPLKKVN